MSQPTPTPARYDRARTHIKALATEAKTLTEGTTGTTAMPFGSGMLTGLAAAVQILDGGTAEAAMETIVQRLEASIGKAYLDGQLPAQPSAPAPAPPVGLVELLKRTEAHLSALHGSVAWHDNLGANLACSGCELRDAIRTALKDQT
ncbi:hypothetical protein [Streptomyces europaeiscabiei]|uniref:hypothetical protein n=1 Tax=Streptomyces europaeiscabiei TaxID=146819 RepID=UPI000765C2DF|nr:hypothetical protein [Streptomyces europaeiscabiei]MDX3831364.1 hypothetical protein [Streptomyces europaeiscabiei]